MAIMTLAQARENFLAAMGTLRSSKVRSALTVLGIVIGVSSVISMAAIIQGLNKFVQDKVESLGSRTYFLSRFPPGTDPSHWPESIRTRRYLQYDYADFVRQAAPDVHGVTTVGTRGFFFGDTNLITSGNRSVEKVIVRGAEPQYIEAIPLFAIERGALSVRSTRSMRVRWWCWAQPSANRYFRIRMPSARRCVLTARCTRSLGFSSMIKACSWARVWIFS